MQRNITIDAQRHLSRELSASLYCVHQYKARKHEVGLITVSQTNSSSQPKTCHISIV